MNFGAVIVENRLSKGQLNEVIHRHKAFLPGSFGLLHIAADIGCVEHYNKIMTSREFWEAVPFDKVLIFQHDSGLLRYGIEEFFNYDYVGAPWKFQEHGGNGGLSFRSKKAMLDIIDAWPYRGMADGYEDVYFSNKLRDYGYNLAPREVCKRFSVETIFELGTLGYHAIDKWLSKEQCDKILNQYNNG